jgi:hypothetical protein
MKINLKLKFLAEVYPLRRTIPAGDPWFQKGDTPSVFHHFSFRHTRYGLARLNDELQQSFSLKYNSDNAELRCTKEGVYPAQKRSQNPQEGFGGNCRRVCSARSSFWLGDRQLTSVAAVVLCTVYIAILDLTTRSELISGR